MFSGHRQRIAESTRPRWQKPWPPPLRAVEKAVFSGFPPSGGQGRPCRCLDAAHGKGVGTVVPAKRVHVARVEVQVGCVDLAGRPRRRRPVVAGRADASQDSRLTVAVARSTRFSGNRWIECPGGVRQLRHRLGCRAGVRTAASGLRNLPDRSDRSRSLRHSGSRRAVRRRVLAASAGSETALQMLDAAHGKTVRPGRVVQRAHAARAEVQEARVDIAGRRSRRAPDAALGADARQGSAVTVAVARSNRQQSLD